MASDGGVCFEPCVPTARSGVRPAPPDPALDQRAPDGEPTASRARGRLRIVLVDPITEGRSELLAWLAGLDIEVAPFLDPQVAFLFILGRADEVDGVLVNGDDEPQAARLLRRLEMLPVPVPVVTYSSLDPTRPPSLAIAGR
jgi:hypothetical protein